MLDLGAIELDLALTHEVDEWLYQATEGIVQSGPFKDMKLLQEKSWPEDSISSKLLGCYEQELHPVIENEIARLASKPNPCIVNVGCAEGYYAVGLAKRLPHATVWAVDTTDKALEIANRAAAVNGVKLVTGAELTEVFKHPDLIVMDCEGAEVAYLQTDVWPGIGGATIVVEIHNIDKQRTDEILYKRFKDTHTVEMIVEGGRNPNIYSVLQARSSRIKWTAVNEHRPMTMYWYVMTPLVVTKIASDEATGRVCGECTLCCKLERIPSLNKPPNSWCEHCDTGVGCTVYERRPKECRTFRCLWLDSTMPDAWRPDKVHLYAEGSGKGGYVKVCVDPAYPLAWQGGFEGAMVVEAIKSRGLHAIVQVGRQVNFVQGKDKEMPSKILLDWTL